MNGFDQFDTFSQCCLTMTTLDQCWPILSIIYICWPIWTNLDHFNRLWQIVNVVEICLPNLNEFQALIFSSQWYNTFSFLFHIMLWGKELCLLSIWGEFFNFTLTNPPRLLLSFRLHGANALGNFITKTHSTKNS